MKPDAHADAFQFLQATFQISKEQIERLSPSEIESLLEDSGYDIAKLNRRISIKQSEWAGRFALLAARRLRLASSATAGSVIPVPDTKEALLELIASLGELPMAAQKCKGMDYGELVQLYRDLMKGKK